MRLNTSSASLFSLSSLLCLGSSLPFSQNRAVDVPLVGRATYSIVPVDGGSSGAAATSALGSSNGDTTIIETITQIPSPKTVIETDTATLPATTDYIISTRTVRESKTTETVVESTTSPSLTTITTTEYSIVNVNPTTVYIPEPLITAPSSSLSLFSSSSLSAKSSPSTATFTTVPFSSSTKSEVTSSLSLPTSTHSTSLSSAIGSSVTTAATLSSSSRAVVTSTSSRFTSTLSFVTGILTSSSPSTTSTTVSYDNGQWHTIYPAWSNSTATRAAQFKAVQTPAATKLPALSATIILAVPSDSVPLNNAADIANGAPGEKSISPTKRSIAGRVF